MGLHLSRQPKVDILRGRIFPGVRCLLLIRNEIIIFYVKYEQTQVKQDSYSTSSSRVISSQFLQVSPLHSPQAATHFSPCLRQEQLLLPHGFFVDDLHHLQRTNLNRSSGAAPRSVKIGVSWLPDTAQPHSVASNELLDSCRQSVI